MQKERQILIMYQICIQIGCFWQTKMLLHKSYAFGAKQKTVFFNKYQKSRKYLNRKPIFAFLWNSFSLFYISLSHNISFSLFLFRSCLHTHAHTCIHAHLHTHSHMHTHTYTLKILRFLNCIVLLKVANPWGKLLFVTWIRALVHFFQ